MRSNCHCCGWVLIGAMGGWTAIYSEGWGYEEHLGNLGVIVAELKVDKQCGAAVDWLK